MKEKFDKSIASSNKSILVTGNDWNNKHLRVLQYLNSLGKKLKVLVRINSMQNCETFLKQKIKTGTPIRVGNLTLYVDSMNVTSQRNTPKDFNCIIVYPIDSLQGIKDDNIYDILNNRKTEKIFWVSWHDDLEYTYLKEICDIKDKVTINDHKADEEAPQRHHNSRFDKVLVDNLGYSTVEAAISKKYKLGSIYTSGMGESLVEGEFSKYIFCGSKSKTIAIKVKHEKEDGKFILLTAEV